MRVIRRITESVKPAVLADNAGIFSSLKTGVPEFSYKDAAPDNVSSSTGNPAAALQRIHFPMLLSFCFTHSILT
jgi:hypothetical protein